MERLPKLTADGANIISGEHVDRVMIAAAATAEQAQHIVRAVNTFDQAREALRKVLKHHECYHNVELHDCEICTAKEALAAMEAAYE